VFTIGSFAGLAGVSAKVLRSYDGLGLFRPAWTDPSSGYRFYSPAQLPELRRILALRDMGIGLAEISRLVAGGDLREALARRRDELERERREIERRLASLQIRVEMSAAASAAPDVVVRPIRAEPIATLTLEDGEDFADAFYLLEAHVRDTGRRARRPPGTLAGGTGGELAEIFVPVSGPIPTTDRIGYRRLPACQAATVLSRGPYEELPAARAILDRWIRDARLEAAGPLRIIYLQFGAEAELRVPTGYVVERSAEFVTELQQPIG
jgi:DNA-binding transcriptional MerR regulator